MKFPKPSAGVGLQSLWRDLNVLLESWPDKQHQFYKDLYNLMEDYSTSPDRPTRLPTLPPRTRSSGSASQRGYQMEPWMEVKKTIENMVLEEIHLILNGTDPEDKFIRENQPNEEAAEVVQDRSEFAATAAEEAAIINQQINAQGPDQYGMMSALRTDQEHWEKYGIFTGEDLAKEMLMGTYSDLYKSYHGFRPRGGISRDMSVEELSQALDDLEQYIISMQDDEPAVEEPELKMAVEPGYEPGDEYEKLPMQSGTGRRFEENQTGERPGPGRQQSRYEKSNEDIQWDGFAGANYYATGENGKFVKGKHG